jgi:plasmid replication initiation protein
VSLKKSALVEKRNILNELRSNNMTLQELRFFSIYLSKINARVKDSRVVKFSVADFQKIMEIERARISHIETTTDSLLCKIVHIPLESGGYESFQLFKKCKVDKDKNGMWYVEIDCHDEALPYLFEYKARYFTYQLWNALRLKSANQLRMYEILKQYEKVGEREIGVQELRELIGIEKDEYPRWDNFKTWVLDVCQKALLENTDIKFTYVPIKKGKGGKVVAVKFKIEKNADYVDQLTLDEFIDLQPEVDTIFDTDYRVIENESEHEPEDEQSIRFKDDSLELLADACNREFDEEQMEIIKGYLVKLVPFYSKTHEIDRYDYLLSKYRELNYSEKKKKEKGGKIADRYKYLVGMLKIELSKMGAADETKW